MLPTPPLAPEFAHLADFDMFPPGVDLAPMRNAIVELVPPPEPIDGVVSGQATAGVEPGVVVETFTPAGDGPHSALLWFHGGGYVIGAPALDGTRMQDWTHRLGCVTASVDYRLAPDHPFPAAHDDAVTALQWLVESSAALGVDTERIVIGGASAGAGLAAGLALSARDRGVPLAGQLLFYPMLDDRQATPSSRWDAPVWSPGANEMGWRAYLGAAYGGDVPAYAAPARAENVDGLAPAMVIVGGVDGFFDEDVSYATRLTRAGVPTELRVYGGAPHGFDLLAPESTVAAAAVAEAERWLTTHLAPT